MFIVMENSKQRLKENSTEYFGDLQRVHQSSRERGYQKCREINELNHKRLCKCKECEWKYERLLAQKCVNLVTNLVCDPSIPIYVRALFFWVDDIEI